LEKRLLRYLLQLIKKVKSAVEQSSLIRELAKFSDISEAILLSEMSEIPDEKVSSHELKDQEDKTKVFRERINLIADRLLAIAFSKDDFFEKTKAYVEFLPPIFKEVFNNPKSPEAAKFQMLSSLIQSEDQKKINEEFNELLNELQIEFYKKELANLKSHKIKGENEENLEESSKLEKIQFLSKKINDLRNRMKT